MTKGSFFRLGVGCCLIFAFGAACDSDDDPLTPSEGGSSATGGLQSTMGGTGGVGGVGGVQADPEIDLKPTHREPSDKFCPSAGFAGLCDSPQWEYVYDSDIGCGMRRIFRQDDSFQREVLFYDEKTDELLYWSTLDDLSGCSVYEGISNTPPVCATFVKEPCGALGPPPGWGGEAPQALSTVPCPHENSPTPEGEGLFF